jgi:hypothetical protein
MAIRNNEDRTGERKITAADPTAAVAAASGNTEEAPPAGMSLDFSCPTEFVELPSRGLFYPEEHPLHGQEHIEIRFMTAKDEDILTSKSLLKKGVAIDRFLQNIIVDNKIKVADLLIGDKNALVVASRITGYGSDYKTKVTCPACGTSQDNEFDLEHSSINHGGLDAIAENSPETAENIKETENNTWIVQCPKSKVYAELQLLTGHHEKFLAKAAAMKKKQKLPETSLTDQLRQTIVSVNGNSEKVNINKFIDVMPALDSRFLRTVYEKLMPNIDLTQGFECHSCGFEQEMEVPFTTDFFWPKR